MSNFIFDNKVSEINIPRHNNIITYIKNVTLKNLFSCKMKYIIPNIIVLKLHVKK